MIANPRIPHGSIRCNPANEMLFATPSMRRLTINATPMIIDRPMKCRVSSVGHAQLVVLMKFAIGAARSNSVFGGSAAWPSPKISGCRISPPIYEALAISANVIKAKASTETRLPLDARDRRRNCHNPIHANTPVISMKVMARSAAS